MERGVGSSFKGVEQHTGKETGFAGCTCQWGPLRLFIFLSSSIPEGTANSQELQKTSHQGGLAELGRAGTRCSPGPLPLGVSTPRVEGVLPA
jgi:hypothetical protein